MPKIDKWLRFRCFTESAFFFTLLPRHIPLLHCIHQISKPTTICLCPNDTLPNFATYTAYKDHLLKRLFSDFAQLMCVVQPGPNLNTWSQSSSLRIILQSPYRNAHRHRWGWKKKSSRVFGNNTGFPIYMKPRVSPFSHRAKMNFAWLAFKANTCVFDRNLEPRFLIKWHAENERQPFGVEANLHNAL